jgi:hypothetical protein
LALSVLCNPRSDRGWLQRLPSDERACVRRRGSGPPRPRAEAAGCAGAGGANRAAAKRSGEDEITEREVTVLLAEFATVWDELFPAEQARIDQLLVERVEIQEAALEVRIRAEGLASLVGELRQQGERRAA